MDYRLPDCQYSDSLWLNGADMRICLCRLPEKKPHPGTGLFNTHVLCFEGSDPQEVNTADLQFIMECCGSGLKDVVEHGLYDPRRECGIDDDALERLIALLGTVKQLKGAVT